MTDEGVWTGCDEGVTWTEGEFEGEEGTECAVACDAESGAQCKEKETDEECRCEGEMGAGAAGSRKGMVCKC